MRTYKINFECNNESYSTIIDITPDTERALKVLQETAINVKKEQLQLLEKPHKIISIYYTVDGNNWTQL